MSEKNRGRLLVVDDEPFNLEILTEHLEDEHYEVVTAADGLIAWNILEREPDGFAAVLLDRMMPNMNGMEVLSRIKHHPAMQHLPVVMQTAVGSPDSVREGLQAGAYYYLTKPFDRDLLLAIVAAAVCESMLRQEQHRMLAQQRGTLKMLSSGRFSFRTLDEAHELTALLSSTCPKPEQVAIGLSELLVNAVEHGNLGITYKEKTILIHTNRWRDEVEARLQHADYLDKCVTVDLVRTPEYLDLTIADMGEGFDWQPYLEFSPERAFDPHGRGISMARMLSFAALEYQGRGNVVRARVALIQD